MAAANGTSQQDEIMADNGRDGESSTPTCTRGEDEESEEESIFVLYVSRTHAKKIKTLLESKNALDKGYRMVATTASTTATADSSGGSAVVAAYPNSIAVPILLHHENLKSFHLQEWLAIEGVLGTGYQKCPLSSSRLGNNNSNSKGTAKTSNRLSLVEQCLYGAAEATILKQQPQEKEQSSSSSSLKRRAVLVESIQQLPPIACPRRLETLGDDRTLVIPQRAFAFSSARGDNEGILVNDNAKHDVFGKWFQEQVVATSYSSSADAVSGATPIAATSCHEGAFLQELWKQLATKHNSPRIVRKGGVDPNSRIRQSGYQILWPPPPPICCSNEEDDSTDATLAVTETGPHSPGWITVTEQGIRQSFDLTRVMFSRGNITEKIRFGQTLVQTGECVLDMYAGIGYFTLPALIHGKAALVVACEWNDYAIQALQFNLQDNVIVDPSTRCVVLHGDCRQLAKDYGLVDKFDRVSLGLLPSSEGGWRTAVHALRRDTGGWLHIHGNVPVPEVNHWAKWLCHQLSTFVRDMLEEKSSSSSSTSSTTTVPATMATEWVVICTHVEKVKSFAPTVNHYVADVFVGPMDRLAAATAAVCSSNENVAADEMLSLSRTGPTLRTTTMAVTAGVWHPDGSMEKVMVKEPSQPRPSCALSPDGVLCQAWMRET